MDYVELTEKIKIFAQEHEKKSRYEHSVRVAEMCARLCRRYGLDDDKGYFIGIAHDICKDFSDEDLINLSVKDGKEILDIDKRKPALLHGRAAAVLLQEQFGVNDKEVIEAIVVHTSGEIGMCGLSKCLWLADKIEPGRDWSTDEYRDELMKLSLNEMYYIVFKESYEFLLKKGYEIYPGTKKILDYYEAEMDREKCEN